MNRPQAKLEDILGNRKIRLTRHNTNETDKSPDHHKCKDYLKTEIYKPMILRPKVYTKILPKNYQDMIRRSNDWWVV